MPFVNIAILEGHDQQYQEDVANAVNEAAITALDFPADDRYQLINEYPPHALQLQRRETDRIMLHLVLRSGKTDAQKKAFYRRVTDNLAKQPGIDAHNVMITMTENNDIDWSFADGKASFIDE
ncbi:MAG: tautomerase family protein [Xanthomonadales bacterium]|nr:tautomerase family protein [Xanthomonadales bacterium]|tara:strand:+ start:242 stop:610 length:369 start_codon:yes stop_codon:yes gene_type:complete